MEKIRFNVFAEFTYFNDELRAWDSEDLSDGKIVTKMIENPDTESGEFIAQNEDGAKLQAYVSLIKKYNNEYRPVAVTFTETKLVIYVDDLSNPALTVEVNEIEAF